MDNSNLPIQELQKFGIVDKQNEFNSKLSKVEVEAFKNGSTMHLENENSRLSFALKDNNTKLETNVYFKDVINHKEMSTAELLELSFEKKSQYKVMADYGVITKIDSGYHAGNDKNEKTTILEVENERGKSLFYGNDLSEKMKNFSVGDKIQVENIGINKVTIEAETEKGVREFIKFENVFDVKEYSEKESKFQSKVFEYDPASKNVTSIDTTKLEIKSINGISISEEQNNRLKKGKEVKIDDELTVELSPNAGNNLDLKSTARMLLVTSLAIDGGLSTAIVQSAMQITRLAKAQITQISHSKFESANEDFKKLQETKPQEISTPVVNSVDEKIKPEAKLKDNESLSGILLEKGEANYLHDKENGKSFYLTILDKNNNQKTIWGVDLQEKAAAIPLYQNIDVKFLGKQDVKINVAVKNEEGKTTSMEEKTVNRNSFDVKENDERIISHKEATELRSNSEKLNEIKGFLQSKSRQYPENKSIISSINIIDKFVSAQPITVKESTKNLQVVDYDTYEDANRKKELEKSVENDVDQKVSKGRGR